ncbi:myeloid zinc finger 1-like [Folsomia candida]|uniref:myeloid zinc finger 1-like n=1 Tax=Folsomia candida TaxID=158441 RepID=UPI001605380A|nr:myeloid zinc finger 1-like [Folsomia candida]
MTGELSSLSDNYYEQDDVLDEVEIKVENDDNRNLGADPLGEVDQFFTKHSDNFCDPEERIGFLQKSDHETPIKAKNQSLRKRKRHDSPPPYPQSDLKLNRIPQPRTYSRKRTKATNHDTASSTSTPIMLEDEVVDEVFEVKVEDPDELDNNNEEFFRQSKTPQESSHVETSESHSFTEKQSPNKIIPPGRKKGPFHCPHCQATFKGRVAFRGHVKSHTPGYVPPIRPPCPQCGKSYSSKYQLEAHVRQVHRGERPFACGQDGCGQSFARNEYLTLHLKKVHNIGPKDKFKDPDKFMVEEEEEELDGDAWVCYEWVPKIMGVF